MAIAQTFEAVVGRRPPWGRTPNLPRSVAALDHFCLHSLQLLVARPGELWIQHLWKREGWRRSDEADSTSLETRAMEVARRGPLLACPQVPPGRQLAVTVMGRRIGRSYQEEQRRVSPRGRPSSPCSDASVRLEICSPSNGLLGAIGRANNGEAWIDAVKPSR